MQAWGEAGERRLEAMAVFRTQVGELRSSGAFGKRLGKSCIRGGSASDRTHGRATLSQARPASSLKGQWERETV